MSKSLIITEKPSVAREFAKILNVNGKNDGYIENETYVITWCVGHLVAMSYPEEYDEKYKKWNLQDLPFLPETYRYHIIPEVEKQYNVVNKMLHRADIDTVYWAGDAGKEGQTIEENIRMFGGVREGMRELRVWIDSQTEEEIKRGLREAKPMSDYENLGKSGMMRTIEDYAMGINFSRAMSVKYGSLLNNAAGTKKYTPIAVGRVMTCVLGMTVIREREIRNFTETPFYRVVGTFFAEEGSPFEAEWKVTETSNYFESPFLYKENGFRKKEYAESLIEQIREENAVVVSAERGVSKKKAPLLFNLAELQAECAKCFKISPDETLQAAQELYEKKLTTYPRTDARVLSTAVAKEIGTNLSRLKGYALTEKFVDCILKERRYANIAKTQYTDDSKITDHYAIIPTGQLSAFSSLTDLQKRVFELIVRRFLSIFYPPAQYETVKVVIKTGKEAFFASAKTLKIPGFLEVMGQKTENKEKEDADNSKLTALLGTLKSGQPLFVQKYEVKEGSTKPPKRYTSGSMVLAMENAGQLIEDEELRAQIKGSGIGTSATRAEIIKKLVRIGYLQLNKKTQVLSPLNLGEMVYEVVAMTVPALLNPKMTASWEKGLDGITRGTIVMEEYRTKLEDFIRKETLAMAGQNLTPQILEKIRPLAGVGARGAAAKKQLDIPCPVCGAPLETTPFGYGCSRYKKDKTGCMFAIGAIAGKNLSQEEVRDLILKGTTGTIRGFTSKTKKKFDACLVLKKEEKPIIQFDFEHVEDKVVKEAACPICGGEILQTAFGYRCENYEKENPNGCCFSIGKMAQKSLSEAQVRQLLKEGRTATIRNFKSKTGKKFDARIALNRDESGNVIGLKFDFTDLEQKKVKGVVCPLCGGEIVCTPFGYGCANYEKNNEQSCRFAVGMIAGVKLKESQLKELLLEGKTGVIEGFIAKTGMMFDAALKLNETGQIVFDFPQKPKPIQTNVKCPKCGQLLKKSQWYYECECGFKTPHTLAQKELSEDVVKELLETGKTKEKQTGFLSRAGNPFEAFLIFQEDKISFSFEDAGNQTTKEEKNSRTTE